MSCIFIANLSTIRLTRLDACGAPVTGPDNGIVFDCIASLSMSPQYAERDEVLYQSARGTICARKPACQILTSFETTLTVQAISPEFIELMTGSPVYLGAGGDPVGWDDCVVDCNRSVALEFWAETIGGECGAGLVPYLYGVLPWMQGGTIGDIEIGSEAVELEYTATTRNGGGWGVGPYNVQDGIGGTPGPMLTPLGDECHRRIFSTLVPPPAASCDYTAVPVPTP